MFLSFLFHLCLILTFFIRFSPLYSVYKDLILPQYRKLACLPYFHHLGYEVLSSFHDFLAVIFIHPYLPSPQHVSLSQHFYLPPFCGEFDENWPTWVLLVSLSKTAAVVNLVSPHIHFHHCVQNCQYLTQDLFKGFFF
uniref:Uncharacterized protein n=1 Tax=Cacopsylla melanoneura TaxID=428564 RepID=A0A8D8ZYI0_9HEMI